MLDHFNICKIYKYLYYVQVQIHVQIDKCVYTTVCCPSLQHQIIHDRWKPLQSRYEQQRFEIRQ